MRPKWMATNRFRSLGKSLFPLSAPGMFAAGMFAFIGSYGEFMLASVASLGIQEVQTIPVAIQNFSFAFRQQWTWVSAGVILALIPVVALVLIFQRWVIKGSDSRSSQILKFR